MILHGLPMPPSVNGIYVNNPKTRGRFKSAAGKAFDSEIEGYRLVHSHTLRQFRRGTLYRVRLTFFLPLEKLMTKDGAVKKLDVSNRIKPIEDAICKLLDIDDKDIVEVVAYKTLSRTGFAFVDATIFTLDTAPTIYFKGANGELPEL